jgi:hypothetical protein
MKGHGAKFGRKKEAAIAALLTQKNHEEAARATGIDLKTLKRWLRLPEFQAEFLLVRREAVGQANARVQQNSGAAASVALMLMADPKTPPTVRAHLSLGLLDRANKSVEQDDMLVRLAAMERSLEEQKKKR